MLQREKFSFDVNVENVTDKIERNSYPRPMTRSVLTNREHTGHYIDQTS